MCKHKSNRDYDQIYAKVFQNSINLLENPSNKEKIWSETSKTVCWDILLQEQYGRCSDTVYWAKNSIAHHPWVIVVMVMMDSDNCNVIFATKR